METILGLLIIALIVLIYFYWKTTIVILILSTVVYVIARAHKKESARKIAEEELKIQNRAKQDDYQKNLIVLGDKSIGLFEQMPDHLKIAEEYLNRAESEFSDGAFAPFWDAIENSATALARFDESVQTIRINASKYQDLIPKYEDIPPPFPLSRESVEKLAVSGSTAERMKAIVRTAQRDFQFATIFEQRKTNQILVAGFTNLGQALDQMTRQLSQSINDLSDSVDSMTSTLNSMDSRLGDMAENINNHHDEIMKMGSARARREKLVLQKLDNIQYQRI